MSPARLLRDDGRSGWAGRRWSRIKTPGDDYDGWVETRCVDASWPRTAKPMPRVARSRPWRASLLTSTARTPSPATRRCSPFPSRRASRSSRRARRRTTAAGSPSGCPTIARLGPARRPRLRAAVRADPGADRPLPPLPRPALHLGRHLVIRLRLLRLHADAMPPRRGASCLATRSRRPIGTGWRRSSARIFEPATCSTSAGRGEDHPHRLLHRQRRVHSRDNQHAPVRADQQLERRKWTKALVACRRWKQ